MMALVSWFAERIEHKLAKNYQKTVIGATHEEKYPLLMQNIRGLFIIFFTTLFYVGLFVAGYFLPHIITSTDISPREKIGYSLLICFGVSMFHIGADLIRNAEKMSGDIAKKKYGKKET